MKIFAFPFAGGDSYCYRDFQKKFTEFPIETLALPGRGKRFGEPCLDNIDAMVDEAIRQFQLAKGNDFLFYGHSMGAIIAYRTTLKLKSLNLPEPKFLFFSGRKGPSLNTGKGNRHKLPSKEFRLELENLGGCPKEVLQNKELMEIFEKFGTVVTARVAMDRDTGKSKGFGFVEMQNAEEGKDAIENLKDISLGKKPLIVKEAEEKSGPPGGGGGFRPGGGNANRGGFNNNNRRGY